MIKKIRQFLMVSSASLAMLFSGLAVPLAGGVASADIQANLCTGVNAAADNSAGGASCGASTTTPDSGLKKLATDVTKWFSIVVGAAAVFMIIYGGFRYITSGGDSNRVGSAKNTLIYAIIGLIIVALAQIIVRFVVNQSTSSASGL